MIYFLLGVGFFLFYMVTVRELLLEIATLNYKIETLEKLILKTQTENQQTSKIE